MIPHFLAAFKLLRISRQKIFLFSMRWQSSLYFENKRVKIFSKCSHLVRSNAMQFTYTLRYMALCYCYTCFYFRHTLNRNEYYISIITSPHHVFSVHTVKSRIPSYSPSPSPSNPCIMAPHLHLHTHRTIFEKTAKALQSGRGGWAEIYTINFSSKKQKRRKALCLHTNKPFFFEFLTRHAEFPNQPTCLRQFFQFFLGNICNDW